jgi:hypothetical protein
MGPRPRDFVGPSILALVLVALIVLLFIGGIPR